MKNISNMSNLINHRPLQITTNTIILIIIAIIALYILIKVISGVIKIIALIAVCWFVLMSVQSTNVVNIPLVKQAYVTIEKIIPSKELWIKASGYIKDVSKIHKVMDDLNSSK